MALREMDSLQIILGNSIITLLVDRKDKEQEFIIKVPLLYTLNFRYCCNSNARNSTMFLQIILQVSIVHLTSKRHLKMPYSHECVLRICERLSCAAGPKCQFYVEVKAQKFL
jgi:hypothetical protein